MRVAAILLPATVSALAALTGTTVAPLKGGAPVDVGALLAAPTKQCVIFGTYAADFNAIEYAQRARHYLPKMRAKGVDGVSLILNAEPAAAAKACELLGVDADEISVFCDPTGAAGRAFGCSRGWLPDEDALFDSIPLNAHFRRADTPRTGRGDAAVTTWIFRGTKSLRRRGRDADVGGDRRAF